MTEPFVVASKLNKAFGAKRVLEDLSFRVDPGDVVGVLGHNGAGKTTLIDLMLGFSPATSGSIEMFGHASFGLPASAKARIGFVPQTDELIRQLTVRDQLGVIGSFYASWDPAFIERLTREWQLDLDARVGEMSVGQRQKLSILLALGHRPDLLVLDEPVASLDPLARRQFLKEIIDVAADGKRSIIFSSHIVSDIERLATRIWILKDGHLYWDGDFDSLKDSVVRIHVRANGSGAETLAALADAWSAGATARSRFPDALSIDRGDRHLAAVVRNWSADVEEELRETLDIPFEVERLALEEIFLELTA
jgi:ABC-2 type transport system ATP-binding protein